FSGSARLLWRALRDYRSTSLRLIDVASGAGDVPVRLWRRARRAGRDWHVRGCDLSPLAVDYARARAERARAAGSFFVHDALAEPFPADCDAATCSLFLHHLDDDQACLLLRRLAGLDGSTTRPRLVLVHDLTRSRTGLLLAHVAGQLLTRSDVVHTDGPRSV